MNTASFFNRSHFVACAGALLFFVAPLAVHGQFDYFTNNGAITITGYAGPGGAVNIPAQINGLPVTSIGYVFWGSSVEVFAGSDLTSVTVPDSVTFIDDLAFAFCTNLSAINVSPQNPAYSSLDGVLFNKGLTKLVEFPEALGGSYTVPNSVTSLGGAAFSGCQNLTSVTIPNALTNIDLDGRVIFFGGSSDAFYGCSSLRAINVSAQNPVYSSLNGVLFDKSQSRLLLFPMGVGGGYTIPEGVTNIGAFAFGWCSLTSATIPDGVTSIGYDAFWGCEGLTNVTIGNGVTNMGDGTFMYCSSLRAINVSAQNPVYSSLDGVLFDKSQSTLISFPMGLGGSYAVPNSVTNIADYAFYNCASLASVTILDHVAFIGEGAFDECSSLSGVAIPNTVTNIGVYTFWACSNLATVTIGKGLTNIGDYAFTHCEHLTGVYFKGDPPGVGSAVFGYNNLFDPATIYYLPNTSGWSNTFAGRPTAPWLPRARVGDGDFAVRSNQFGFNIAWASGQTAIVEAATNLSNPFWVAVATNTLTTDTAYFSDAAWTNLPQRFYRVAAP